MKTLKILIIAVVAIVSIAAGLAKVMQAPQEMEFLQGAGLSSSMIFAFGLLQVLGGVLLIPGKTLLAALAFLVSTVLIFASGNLSFGLVSILPVALTCVIIYHTLESK